MSNHSKASDVYSLALVFLHLATRKVPFSEIGSFSEIQAKRQKSPADHPKMVHGLSDSLSGLLRQCWNADPEARPQIDSISRSLEQGTSALYGISS